MNESLKNILFWAHGRGTWQYDVLCLLIVLALMLWPEHKLHP